MSTTREDDDAADTGASTDPRACVIAAAVVSSVVTTGRKPGPPTELELYECAATVMDTLPPESDLAHPVTRRELAVLLDMLTATVSPEESDRRRHAVRRFLRDAGWVRR